MAILSRFSAISLLAAIQLIFAFRCRILGDSRPAILGIVRFADSVSLRVRGALRLGVVSPHLSVDKRFLHLCRV